MEISADVRNGEYRDALLYAVSANASHGIRRTNADKRRAVEMALADPEIAEWSNTKVAELCKVSDVYVGKVKEVSNVRSNGSPPPVVVYRNKHGGVSKMNVANIGKARRKVAATGGVVRVSTWQLLSARRDGVGHIRRTRHNSHRRRTPRDAGAVGRILPGPVRRDPAPLGRIRPWRGR